MVPLACEPCRPCWWVVIDVPGCMHQLKPEEMYSKMFYLSKIKPCVDREVMVKGERLSFIRKLTQEMYEAENESVKLEVMAKLEEECTKKMEDTSACGIPTPEQYLRHDFHCISVVFCLS